MFVATTFHSSSVTSTRIYPLDLVDFLWIVRGRFLKPIVMTKTKHNHAAMRRNRITEKGRWPAYNTKTNSMYTVPRNI